jgi:HAD superfamily hydrolase (TIGR01490 family)
MVRLAIYDMDRTITRRGTYTPFLLHAALRLSPWRLLLAPIVVMAFIAYALKAISRSRLKEFNQYVLLGPALRRDRLARVTKSFAEATLANNFYADAARRIAADRDEGWRVVIATASYRLYVEDIARALGVADVIATNSLAGLDQRVLARIDGENCYGPAKLRMIRSWLIEQKIDREAAQVRFYSDHVSDAPVLEWADEAVAVCPSPKLRRLAMQRGWQIIDWKA